MSHVSYMSWGMCSLAPRATQQLHAPWTHDMTQYINMSHDLSHQAIKTRAWHQSRQELHHTSFTLSNGLEMANWRISSVTSATCPRQSAHVPQNIPPHITCTYLVIYHMHTSHILNIPYCTAHAHITWHITSTHNMTHHMSKWHETLHHHITWNITSSHNITQHMHI